MHNYIFMYIATAPPAQSCLHDLVSFDGKDLLTLSTAILLIIYKNSFSSMFFFHSIKFSDFRNKFIEVKAPFKSANTGQLYTHYKNKYIRSNTFFKQIH